MENNDNNNFSLLIRNKQNTFQRIKYNLSDLNNYNKICKQINNICEQNESQKIVIEFKNKNEADIKVYDKEEWDILYNYNIIDEFIKGNKLKIHSEKIKKKEIINKKENLKIIFNYISKKLSQNFYSNLIFKFFSNNKDILDSFISFYMNELKNTNIKEIEKNIDTKDKNIKENIIELINNTDTNKGNINFNINNNNINNNNINNNNNNINNINNNLDVNKEIINDNKNDYYLDKEYINQNEILLKNLINIYDIIKDFKEEKIELKNINDNITNNTNVNVQNINKENNVLTSFKINNDKDINKFFDDKNYFKKITYEEYYQGIEEFKNELNKEILNIK